jgi:hypothetical protein
MRARQIEFTTAVSAKVKLDSVLNETREKKRDPPSEFPSRERRNPAANPQRKPLPPPSSSSSSFVFGKEFWTEKHRVQRRKAENRVIILNIKRYRGEEKDEERHHNRG